MCVLRGRFCVALCVFNCAMTLAGADLHAEEHPGAKLFVERWASHDKRSPEGDGLGPMHNAASCAACHHQAGPGGGGDGSHNVELLSVVPVERREAAEKHFAKRLIALHPGFGIRRAGAMPTFDLRPNLVLHRFGPEGDYFDFRARLLGMDELRDDVTPQQRAVMAAAFARRSRRSSEHVRVLEPEAGIKLKLSQRNTPALWGAGLIDEINLTVLDDMVEEQKRTARHVVGRRPRTNNGGLGRFGWRGQTSTLRKFVVGACANELGLQTNGNEQAVNPLNPDYASKGPDMAEGDVAALVSFVASLPRPVEIKPTAPSEAETARNGERIFKQIGCGDCHPRQVGEIDGLFSDLLLHDMGTGLADPVEPIPDFTTKSVPGTMSGYSGGGRVFVLVSDEIEDPTLPQQWRTPPLWGVADSAPYLHDGRAATLADAIAQHGGQGSTSAIKFRNLSRQDRGSLIAFLETLRAPEMEP